MELPKYIIKAFKLKEVKENSTNITYEEIEAIPIEWLEEYIEESIPRKEHLPYWYKRNWKNRLQMMIEDWRKENEID